MDRLRVGSDNLWGGVVGPDDGPNGVFCDGPQPAGNTIGRFIVRSNVREEPLPVHLAQMVLTRDAKLEQRLRRMLARARIQATVAQMPVETFVRRGLVPLRVGKGR